MQITDLFPSTVDPNNISVYIGRVIKLDDNFESNGVLYVDLVDPDSSDLDRGARTSDKATASYAVRTLYRCWGNPPEIKSKVQFDGSMSFTSNGDFHLKNYCFDMMTQTWFMTVSTALNALGIVNVPPVMVSLDTTPFPGQAVAINVSSSAKEVADESIQSALSDLSSDKTISNNTQIPTVEEVKVALGVTPSSTTQLRKTRSGYTGNDPVIKVINSIVTPLGDSLNETVKPLLEFLDCISLLLQIYEKNLNNVSEITIPITQFATIKEDGSIQDISPLTDLAIKTDLQNKINQFKTEIQENLSSLTSNVKSTLIDKVYAPIAYIYDLVNTQIYNIVNQIKTKIKDTILRFIKEPLSQLVSYIAMAIQPVVSSLPTIVQLIVKLALKKLLQVLMGQPIKLLLKAVIEPLENIIDLAVDKIEDMVSELISTAINTIVNPLVGIIQKSLASLIPFFNMNSLKSFLTEILSDMKKFPKIYIGTNAIKPYKDFNEINWSDPQELSAMLLALIEEVNKEGYTPSTISIPSMESVEEIWKIGQIIQGVDLQYKGNTPVTLQVGEEQEIIINHNDDLVEGTIKSGDNINKELYYRKFSSKDDFLPYFIKVHEPDNYIALIGEEGSMFKEITSSKWLTNSVPYIDIEIQGEKKRLICGSNVYSGQISEAISVRIPEKETYIELNPSYLYETRLVQHIQVDENDPPIGEDLVPIVDESNNVIPLKLQKIRKEDNELLYKVYKDSNETLSFSEIAKKYYIPSSSSLLSDNEIVQDLIDILNEANIDPNSPQRNTLLNNIYPNSLLGKCLSRLKTTNLDYSYVLNREVSLEDSEKEMKEFIIKTPFSDAPIFASYTNNKLSLTLTSLPPITIPKQTPIFVGNQTEVRINIDLNHSFNSEVNKHIYSKSSYSIKTQIQIENPQGWYTTSWDNNKSVLYYKVNEPDEKSTEYYCWMLSGLEQKEFSTSGNKEKVESILNSMLQQSVSAIGQEEGFSAAPLMQSVSGKVFSPVDQIADSLTEVNSLVQSTLERVEELKEIDSMVETLSEVGDKVKEVADTAGPALEATAKASSSVAIQSCSMTQSASGKDFSFNSGNNYDLSTTTDSQSQLPYCKELSREQFLEPNCKVIVLAVGAGKQNLYVVDILT